ncbi:MAG: T9SS type A sorting domain-containing protein [Candidatus Cloacimonetes bacterium]|nr:T9SS type A sorting domain-containing protein [Candidatus Cloacimonadota bacterium]
MSKWKFLILLLVVLIGNRLFSQEAHHLIISPEEFENAATELTSFSLGEFEVVREIYFIEDIIAGSWNPAESLYLFLEDYFSDPLIEWDTSSVLLLGSGTSNWNSGSERNRIPVYITNQIASDGMYVDFDGDSLPDVSIGRIPASNSADLESYLEKYYAYMTEAEAGLWQRRLLFSADDEMKNGELEGTSSSSPMNHSQKSDELMAAVENPFIIKQVYGIDYEMDENGEKPQAKNDIIATLNEGVNLWTFVGHASGTLLGDEHYFQVEDIAELSNTGKEPFMFVAGCNVGAFSGEEACLAERLMFTEGGIVSGVFASYDSSPLSNIQLGCLLLSRLYNDGDDWGTGLRLAKAESGASISNSKKYNLFGDPLGKIRAGDAAALQLEPEITDLLPGTETLCGWNCGFEYEEAHFVIMEASSWIEYSHTIEDVTFEYNRWRPGEIVLSGNAEVSGGRAEYLAELPASMVEGDDGQIVCWSLGTDGKADFYFSENIPVGDNSAADEDIVTGVMQVRNYPNPFNPSTVISYYLPENSKTEIAIYNIKGEKIIREIRGNEPEGWHEWRWNGRDEQGRNMSSGIYMVRIKSDDKMVCGRMNLLK